MASVQTEKQGLFPIENQHISSPESGSSTAGRSKVNLKPGRSLMDWVRLTHSGIDLTGTGGKLLEITTRELAKHNTPKDAWIAIRGKVYNVTHYLEFHPGGEDELMRGIGMDATDLFNQVHRWVNADSMLQKCFVGILKKSWCLEVSNFKPLKYLKMKHKNLSDTSANHKNASSLESNDNCKKDIISETNHSTALPSEQKYDLDAFNDKQKWPGVLCDDIPIQGLIFRCVKEKASLRVHIGTESNNMKYHGLIVDLIGEELHIVCYELNGNFIKLSLDTSYENSFEVELKDKSADIVLINCSNSYNLKELGAGDSIKNTVAGAKENYPEFKLYKFNDQLIFWSCKLIEKSQINYNTFLFTFLLPPGTKMWIPIGYHVHIKGSIEGMEVTRSYTPISSLLTTEIQCPETLESSILFMIKIYSKGAMTQMLDKCNIGDLLYISSFSGSFSVNMLVPCDEVVMLAAGTGITPMIRIIQWILSVDDKQRFLSLYFFNKREEDILWKDELEKFKNMYSHFNIIHILSDADENWHGYSGRLNHKLIFELLPVTKDNTTRKILVCGPLPFTECALRCLEKAGIKQDEVYAFTGS